MPKQATYRRLASSNWRIAEARSLIDLQKGRVLELADRPGCGHAARLPRLMERSLRLMIYSRAILIEQLVNWPPGVTENAVRRQLANLKSSGDYARHHRREVKEDIEREHREALKALERVERERAKAVEN